MPSRRLTCYQAPSSIDPNSWFNNDSPELLVAVIDGVRRKHTFDPRRRYLFGHSAGANYSLFLALERPGYFAAIAAHAGTLNPDYEESPPMVAARTPIHMQVGTVDPVFPLENVRHTRDLFRAAGFEFELIEIAGHDHDYYGIADQVNRRAWEFLKSKTLPAPTR